MLGTGTDGNGQRAFHRLQGAVEAQFAHHHIAVYLLTGNGPIGR